jgi:hypothetical protein
MRNDAEQSWVYTTDLKLDRQSAEGSGLISTQSYSQGNPDSIIYMKFSYITGIDPNVLDVPQSDQQSLCFLRYDSFAVISVGPEHPSNAFEIVREIWCSI